MQHKCIDDTDCKFNSDFSTAYKNDSNSNFSLMNSINNNNSDTNNNYNAKFKKT